jgi:hypothetical protein
VDHAIVVAILGVVAAAITALPPLLAEIRRWRGPPRR